MPIEHIGVDAGPEGIRLVRVEAGFGTAVFRVYETRALAAVPEHKREEPEEEAPEPDDEELEASEEAQDEEEEAEPEGPAPWTPLEESIQATLAEMAGRGTFETQFTATAMNTGLLTTRLMSFPFSSRKKLDLVLEPEFESLTPFEAEDFLFDHTTVQSGDEGARLQAYALPHQAMERFITGCENGHFDPRIVTVTGAALAALPLSVDASAPVQTAGEAEEEAEAPATAEEAWYQRESAPAPADDEEKELKLTGARTLLEANDCTALLYLGESETVLVILRKGSPWLLHASQLTLEQIHGNENAAKALGSELRRQLLGFEANHGVRPDQLWALGAGAASSALLKTLAAATSLQCEPGKLDPESVGEEAAKTLERHPEAALALGLAYLSARARQVPAPNFRRGPYAFRSRWRELAEPLATPAILAVVALVLFLINSLVEFRNYRDDVEIARAQLEQLYTQARGKAPPPGIDPVQVLTTEVDEKRARLEIFRKISGISVLNILAELSRAIKEETPVDFENFRIDNDRVSINGKFDDYAAVDKITNYLTGSKVFSKVDFRDAVPGTDDKIKFRLSLTLATADGDEDEEFPEEETPAEFEAAPAPAEEASLSEVPAEPAPEDEQDTASLELPAEEATPVEEAAPPPPEPAPEPAEAAPPAPEPVDDGLTPAQRRVKEQLRIRQEREERQAERRRKRMERNQESGSTGGAGRDERIRKQREKVRERIEKLRQERGVTNEEPQQ